MNHEKQIRIDQAIQRFWDANQAKLTGEYVLLLADRAALAAAVVALRKDVLKLIGEEAEAFRKGWNVGVAAFAWWKDGEQFVGTCGKRLKDVLAEGPSDADRPEAETESARMWVVIEKIAAFHDMCFCTGRTLKFSDGRDVDCTLLNEAGNEARRLLRERVER